MPPTNLPEPVSELIGRDDELREVVSLAAAHRLVTLTGPGGIGKTRLALAVARELLPKFPDGVWLAELAPLSDPGLVPATVAAAAGLELGAGAASPERVANALTGKQLLLVLDNCEHVIDAAASMAEALLRASPAVHVIATSREPLRAEGEQVYPVPPLAVPAEDAEDGDDFLRYGAVRLFLERARAAEPQVRAGPSVLRRWSRRSAGGSMAFRWRSSWPRRARRARRRGTRRPPRRSLPSADRRTADGAAAASDLARDARLELRPSAASPNA